MKEIKLGKYRHSKSGKMYKIVGTGKHSETLEDLVFYEALYDNKLSKLWARPLEMFVGEVEIEGELKPRFEYLDE